MHFAAVFLLATGAAANLASESIDELIESLGAVRKRQLVSCEASYGKGSVNCGDSTFCYNPTIGQSCCSKTDFGFCEKGSYCAPVAGFCCMEGESLADCAQAGGFQLPATVTQSVTTTVKLPNPSAPPSMPAPLPPSPVSEPCTTASVLTGETAFPLPATTPSAVSIPGPVTVPVTVPVVPYPTGGGPSVVGTGSGPATTRPAVVIPAGAARTDRSMFVFGLALGAVAAVAALC